MEDPKNGLVDDLEADDISGEEGDEMPPENENVEAPEGASPADPVNADDEEDPELALLGEEYDPQIVSIIRKQHAQIKELRKTVGQFSEMHEQQVRERAIEQTDRAFSTLFDDYSEHIGEGPTDALAPESTAFKARMELIQDAHALAKASYERGEEPPPIEEVFRRAARAKFAGGRSDVASRRASQSIHRPSGRVPQEGDAKTKAVALWADLDKRTG